MTDDAKTADHERFAPNQDEAARITDAIGEGWEWDVRRDEEHTKPPELRGPGYQPRTAAFITLQQGKLPERVRAISFALPADPSDDDVRNAWRQLADGVRPVGGIAP